MSVYSELLQFPGVRQQVIAATVSRMTQPLLRLPLLVGTVQAYNNHAFAALVVGLYTASFALMMPVTGRLVDRHGGRVILRIWLALALTALLGASAAMARHAPMPVLVAGAIALGACLPPVGAVTRSGWPVLVPATQLRAAYALDSVINEVATIAGPLLAGLALTTLRAPTALLLSTVALAVGSLGLPSAVLAPNPHGSDEARPDMPRSRRLVLTYGIALCASIGVGSVVTTAGLSAADAGRPGLAGVLLAAVAVGAVAAGAAAGRRGVAPDVVMRRLAGYSAGLAGLFVVLSLGLHGVGGLRGHAFGIVAIGVLYLAFGCLTGPRDALLQLSVVTGVPAARRGAAFSWLGTCGLLGFGLGSAASGYSGATVGLPFLAATLAAFAAATLSVASLRP